MVNGKHLARSGRVFTLTRYGERLAIVGINDSVDGVTCRQSVYPSGTPLSALGADLAQTRRFERRRRITEVSRRVC
jgi:hypothetical protein